MLVISQAREDEAVAVPSPADLLERVRLLPGGGMLMERLGDEPLVYLVGGALRDLLMGGSPAELDLVVEGDPAEVAEQLGGGAVVHDRFGTSTVRLDGFRYDIARARRERYARPGALPDVEPASLKDDLQRRDFTVNAIATALSGAAAGALETVPGALEDLRARLLRVLHDRSFSDDPIRLLRLARYRGRLGFGIEPHTLELARAAIAADALATVSGARIGAELRLLGREQDPIAALISLRELRLDAAIHPRFGLADVELARRALALLPSDGRPPVLVLAVAALKIPGQELRRTLDGLAFLASEREAIVATAVGAERLAASLGRARMPSEIAAAAGEASPEVVALAGALGPAEAAREWLDRLRHVRLEIDGRDLLSAGVPEGPAVGRALRAALAAKLDGRASGREGELAVAVSAAYESPPAGR